MPARKMRVDVFDEEGNRYTITFEGNVTRKRALSLLDIVELLGGVQGKQESTSNTANVSKFAKMSFLLEKQFPFTWFSSKEVQAAYEEKIGEPIALSTVSTYLARMVDRGMLLGKGSSHNRRYRLVSQLAQGAHVVGDT